MPEDTAASLPPRPASLRDLYTPPLTDWSFNATSGSVPSSSSGSGVSVASAGPNAWSTRTPPQKPRVLDLSPYPYDEVDARGDYVLDARSALKWLVGAALLQYATTGIAMPFEVAKVLMQCQWIPRDSIQTDLPEAIFEVPPEDDEREESDAMSDDSAESYFHDPAREAFSKSSRLPREQPIKLAPADEDGYILRRSINDASTRPEYVIPVGPTDGVWSMIKRIRSWKHEGWLALWKAQLTSTVVETVTPIVQSSVQTLLFSIFAPDTRIPIYPVPPSQIPTSHLLLSLTSHAVTGVILSPLDLVRTRLIVQSSHPSHRTYSGPIHALRSIVKEEGGLSSLYTHPSLLIPAVLDNTIRPFFTLATPVFIRHMLGIAEDTHPITFAFAQFLATSASLLITLPIETIRRRMQVQTRNGVPPLRACIELRPMPYYGVLDTCYRILSEERSSPRPPSSSRGKKNRSRARSQSSAAKGKEKESSSDEDASTSEDAKTVSSEEDEGWVAPNGLAQLYRGFTMSLTANAVVLLLGAGVGVSGEDSGSGWTEL